MFASSDPQQPAAPTVADRLRAAHISDGRVAWWFTREEGAVRVDGQPVTDPHASAAPPARVTLHS